MELKLSEIVPGIQLTSSLVYVGLHNFQTQGNIFVKVKIIFVKYKTDKILNQFFLAMIGVRVGRVFVSTQQFHPECRDTRVPYVSD